MDLLHKTQNTLVTVDLLEIVQAALSQKYADRFLVHKLTVFPTLRRFWINV